MSLSLYNKKRNFSETAEPVGKEKSSKDVLRFVVQKHDASGLHYDFRLEMDGVLKSWAVPKGPSLNTADKRLAMMVEDHPYDYRNFEGVIPEGNYGAGTVIVWDEGTYELADASDLSKKEQEKKLLKALASGNLDFVLSGKKLKGRFRMFQLKNDREGKSWLLVKRTDEFASKDDITLEDQSVKTGKTLAQVAKENGTTLNHPEEGKIEKNKAAKPPIKKEEKENKAPAKVAAKKTSKKKALDVKRLLGSSFSVATEAPMPQNIKPMLATLVEEPFSDPGWIFEIKWDGYRAVGYLQDGQAELISRNNKSFKEKYKVVADALEELAFNAVFDGEIVAVNNKGLGDFQLLQNWQNTQEGKLQYFIFDILWINGFDVTALPLLERKRILKDLLPPESEVLKYSDHVEEKGDDFFKVALKQGLEGMMAKKASSPYVIGSREDTWLKVKVNKRQEVIIVGYTAPRNSRKFFGALLLGVYKDGELIYIGHTGSGFNKKSLEAIYKKLQPLVVDDCPFAKCPKGNMPVTWVAPKLVCEIKFTEWTNEFVARHPIFMGLREDKKAKDVFIEKSKNITTMEKKSTSAPAKKVAAKKASAKKSAPVKAVTKPAKKTSVKTQSSGQQLSLDNGKDQEINLDGQTLKLTNLNKIYWPKEGKKKIDLVNYYLEAAPYILPYMMDRPQSLNRHPNGINGPNFFQKDMEGKLPDWMTTHQDFSESTDKHVQYLVCNSEAVLVYMANLGCIEMHPWHSRTASWQKPDWCLIDLDPQDIGFDKVIECAQVVKKVLDDIGAVGYPKTSGSTGIHIYIPLGAQYDYDQSKQLAELIVTLVHQQIPSFTSIERSPAKRKRKIYLDYLQNRETQTAAAPYSLRPKPGVPVSTPLHWEEVAKGLTPTTYNMNNIFDRLKKEGDLFAPVLGKGIDLEKVLQKVQSLISK